jgi:hypothetical protein
MKTLQFTIGQVALLVAPPLLVLTTYVVFRTTARHFGSASAHWIGFPFYWLAWCLLLPYLTVGSTGLKQMFAAPHPTVGKPAPLGIILLLTPPLSIFLTRFKPEMQGATPTFVLVSLLYALTNGTLEEILWRGTYLVAFPESWGWGLLYPALWFGLWHVAPLASDLETSIRDSLPFALMSIGLGLIWGWVARTSGSIRLVVVAHILLNFGWPAAADFIPGYRDQG